MWNVLLGWRIVSKIFLITSQRLFSESLKRDSIINSTSDHQDRKEKKNREKEQLDGGTVDQNVFLDIISNRGDFIHH